MANLCISRIYDGTAIDLGAHKSTGNKRSVVGATGEKLSEGIIELINLLLRKI
jgi:hypothetical protein